MRRINALVLWSLVAIGASLAGSPKDAGAQRPIGLSEFRDFTLEYTDASSNIQSVSNGDAYTSYFFPYLQYVVHLWQIKIPGTVPVKEVWVGLFVDPFQQEYFAGHYHPMGLPAGWKVNHLEQRFKLFFEEGGAVPPVALSRMAIFLPKVYGPTIYYCDDTHDIVPRYPTFLQTQQVIVTDLEEGGALSMICEDDNGIRKDFGFRTDGTKTGAEIVFRYNAPRFEFGAGYTLPAYQSSPWLWIAKFDEDYSLRFKNEFDLYDQAIDWYRNRQLMRPNSYLSKRTPGPLKIHPYVDDSKFAIGVGASLSTVMVGHQFDLSSTYRTDVLDGFTSLHGSNMLLYHLGWSVESTLNGPALPDAYAGILPGHAAMLSEADAMSMGIKSTAYMLPAVISTDSAHYGGLASDLVVESDGSDVTIALSEYPANSYKLLSWYPEPVTSIYTSVSAHQILDTHGFDGVYLDAITASRFSYAFHQHGHPDGQNEQWLGIDRLITDIRGVASSLSLPNPILFHETPTDAIMTDASGMDFNAVTFEEFSMTKMTYSGKEVPGYAAVFAWDPNTNLPDAPGYVQQLAHCMVAGVRPLILWPEVTGLMPTKPQDDPAFADFVTLLQEYCDDWDTVWGPIMCGRQLLPLDPASYITSVVVPLGGDAANDPIERWRVPGFQPKPNSIGSQPARLSQIGVPAILGCPCIPDGQRKPRVNLLRWTDPKMAAQRNAPPSSPLRKTVEEVKVLLSARNIGARPGDIIRLRRPGKGSVVVGRLPLDPKAKIPITVSFPSIGRATLEIE